MRLLIVTQKVNKNDGNLGFFHEWLIEFAKNVEQLTIICLEKGEYSLPENTRVFSLGKEQGKNRFQYLFTFFKVLFVERKNYDAVLVHMNPMYVVLAGPFWRLMHKKIGLWYTHKHVDTKLKIAEAFSNIVFTASARSFRLQSKKLHVMGHGINTSFFKPVSKIDTTFKIISVGRVSSTKNLAMLIEAAKILKDQGCQFILEIVGNTVTKDDEAYKKTLQQKIEIEHLGSIVQIHDPMIHSEIAPYMASADVFVNVSKTGSLDKVVLEAMSSGVSVVTSNEAFSEMLKKYNLMIEDTPGSVAEKIKYLYDHPEKRASLAKELREEIVLHHQLSKLIQNIIALYETSK